MWLSTRKTCRGQYWTPTLTCFSLPMLARLWTCQTRIWTTKLCGEIDILKSLIRDGVKPSKRRLLRKWIPSAVNTKSLWSKTDTSFSINSEFVSLKHPQYLLICYRESKQAWANVNAKKSIANNESQNILKYNWSGKSLTRLIGELIVFNHWFG